MNDLDAIMEVVDEVSNIKKLDDETLSHAYTLCIDLFEIFGEEMAKRGIITREEF